MEHFSTAARRNVILRRAILRGLAVAGIVGSAYINVAAAQIKALE